MATASDIPVPPPSPPDLPIGLLLGSGFKQYIPQSMWMGVTPSAATVTQFQTAWLKSLTTANLLSPTTLAQQCLFDSPQLWGVKLPTASTTSPKWWFLANATRLAVCALTKSEITQLKDFAAALQSLPFDFIMAAEKIDPPLPLPPIRDPAHKQQMAQLISFFLNMPEICDAYLYSTVEDECIVLNHTLQVDADKLKTCGTVILKKPTPEQTCTSLTVCFWCGASPLSQNVTLTACEGCHCVAYCSPLCQASDWESEHHRECARTEEGVHETAAFGLPSLPASALNITRIATESGKVQRGTVQVVHGAEAMVDVTVTMCFSRTVGRTVCVPMGWEVEA
ncbi:hypothetical protein HDU98_004852 [Podochytrium sp. JEL0797]|nr:hypothetical protein HDU98_004852 [Podochytrium sp. JEL0797]